jgi:hypothetical protein
LLRLLSRGALAFINTCTLLIYDESTPKIHLSDLLLFQFTFISFHFFY